MPRPKRGKRVDPVPAPATVQQPTDAAKTAQIPTPRARLVPVARAAPEVPVPRQSATLKQVRAATTAPTADAQDKFKPPQPPPFGGGHPAADVPGDRSVATPASVAETFRLPTGAAEAAGIPSPAESPAPVAPPPTKLPARRPSVTKTQPSWLSLITLGLGVLGFTFLAWTYLSDVPPVSDDDLRLRLPPDPMASTAAPERLRQFLDSILRPTQLPPGGLPPWEWDTPTLSRFVQANGAAFDNLHDILRQTDWHPRHSDWHRTDHGSHAAWADAILLLQARVAYLARRTGEEAAFPAALEMARLAHHLERLWAWPSFLRRALDLHAATCQSFALLLKDTRLSAAHLKEFQDQAAACAPADPLLQDALNAFYIFEKKLLLGARSQEPPDTMPGGKVQERPRRLFFKTHETLQHFADSIRELKAQAAMPSHTAVSHAADRLRRLRQTARQFYQPNVVGEQYFCERMDPYLELPQAHALAIARQRLVGVLFALRRFVAEQQRVPATLDELRPAFFESLPLDPFSGEPLRYDAKRGRLWSVGTDLHDDKGAAAKAALLVAHEPVVELGIATAAVAR